MNGIFNPIVFYPSAILMILFAILAIYFKNIFYSLLSAVLVFFFAGLIFYILGSEYNAIIQIAIYGVAVPVILGLAIMFTDLKKEELTKSKNSNFKYLVILASGIFILTLSYLVMASLLTNPAGFNIQDMIFNTSAQVISAFGKSIFIKYVWAFELVSLILTIIVVGLVLLNKKGDQQ